MLYKILNIFILFKKWLGIHLFITGRYWITNDLYILKKVLLLSVFCVNSIVIYRPIFPSFSRWTILTYFCINTDNLIQISISCSNLQMYCVIKSIVDIRSIYETIPTKQNEKKNVCYLMHVIFAQIWKDKFTIALAMF